MPGKDVHQIINFLFNAVSYQKAGLVGTTYGACVWGGLASNIDFVARVTFTSSERVLSKISKMSPNSRVAGSEAQGEAL